MWMVVCTYHMVKVFMSITDRSIASHQHRQFMKYFAISESIATILIITLVVYRLAFYGESGYGGDACYIQSPGNILYFVGIPAACMVIANMVMFGFIIVKVARLPDVEMARSSKERDLLTIFFKLSTVTGMTWGFGLVYQLTGVYLFAYLFIICNFGQGVFILFSFVLNKRVYMQLRSLCCKGHAYNSKSNTHATNSRSTSVASGTSESNQ